jgi:hypothetical protein
MLKDRKRDSQLSRGCSREDKKRSGLQREGECERVRNASDDVKEDRNYIQELKKRYRVSYMRVGRTKDGMRTKAHSDLGTRSDTLSQQGYRTVKKYEID